MLMVTIDKEEIRLNSRMEELNFSKTNYDSVVTQQGLLAKSKNNSDGEYNFSFEGWSFADIKSFDTEGYANRVVYYCAKNIFSKNAKTLLDYSNENQLSQAGLAVCAMMTQAAKENVKVPEIGAGGIILDITKDETAILFLPEDLFKFSVGGMSETEYSNIHAHWLNSSIYDLPSLCFERAAIAYKMITNHMPYPTTNQLERNADFLDQKFIPVEMYCKTIAPVLAKSINKALKLNANVVNIPGKRKTGRASEDLTPEPDFPLQALKDFCANAKENLLSEEEFTAKTQEFVKKQASKVDMKRKVRRNKTAIIVGILAVLTVLYIVRTTIKSNGENFTSKGLTSVETIQAYYYGVNQKDALLLDNFTKGGNTEKYNDAVGNIYVVGKMRQSYNLDSGFLSPGRWVYNAINEKTFYRSGLYGVTGLKIDGVSYGTLPDIATIADKPTVLKTENGIQLSDGQTLTHTIEYNLLYTMGEVYEISLEKITGTVTLTYSKNRWVISNFDTDTTTVPVDTEQFKTDYFAALEANENDVLKAVESLREKYNWLADNEAIEYEGLKLKQEQEFAANLGAQ